VTVTEWAGPPAFLTPPPATTRADGVRHVAGASYACPPGYRRLKLDLWVPAGDRPAPLVVWVHGGAWMIGDRLELPETLRPGQVFDALLAAGCAVATVDYRHALEAAFPAQLHDAKAAVRWLRHFAADLGLDTTRMGVWGESAGGHLAALVGLTAHRADLEGGLGVTGPSSAVDVVVDWYGVADLSTMPRMTPPPEIAEKLPPEMRVPPEDLLLAGLGDAAAADASPITHVTATAPPFLLLHGSADWLVPPTQSDELAAALTAAGATAVLEHVPGAGHVWLGHDDVDGLVDRSVAFLVDHLQERPA
jgi:acetyl esterase/lipase